MIKVLFNTLILVALCSCSNQTSLEQKEFAANCVEPTRIGKGGTIIKSSGPSCLKHNLHVDGQWNPFRHGNPIHSDGHFLVAVTENNVLFDLQGYKLSSDAELTLGGIHSPSQTHAINGGQGTLSGFPNSRLVSNISVKNGTVTLERAGSAINFAGLTGMFLKNGKGDLGLVAYTYPEPLGLIAQVNGAGEALVHPKDSWIGDPGELLLDLNEGGFFEKHSSYLPKRAVDYPKRRIRLDNLRINAKRGLGVLIQGADTVIQNCIIEVDESQTAIYLYGPNALIENNTIILHTKYPYMKGDAAIRLFHGDGAVIRNNKFIFKGDRGHRHTVSTIDTGSFLFENNIVAGAKETDSTIISISGEMQARVSGTKFYDRMPAFSY